MLVLRVEYLTGVCMATRHNDPTRSTSEWPPHPDRLYSALVAAAAEAEPSGGTDLSDSAKEALSWLAEQGAPRLHAPRAHRRTSPSVAMRSNPAENEIWIPLRKGAPSTAQTLPIYRKPALLPIPAVVPEEPAVYFIWPDAEPGRHRTTLESICDRVTYLGRSRSLVRVSIDGETPPATHVPDPLGRVQLRVPGPGRLDYLIQKHGRDGGKPAPSPLRRYHQVTDRISNPQAEHGVFGRFWVFRPHPDDPELPVEATIRLAQALRGAVIRQVHDEACGCDRWGHRVPSCREAEGCYAKISGAISGHAPNCGPLGAPHLAYVPLPFVHPMQRHADGAIKGLAVLVPQDVADDTLTLLARALKGVQRDGLQVPRVGTWHLMEAPADDPPLVTLDGDTWTAPSRIWTTATPMVFGHFPKPRNGGDARVVLDSLKLAGFDPSGVVEIAVGSHSPLHGARPSWRFETDRDLARTEPRPWIRHVTIRFDRPIAGPLVLGSLRYFGLGLMLPLGS